MDEQFGLFQRRAEGPWRCESASDASTASLREEAEETRTNWGMMLILLRRSKSPMVEMSMLSMTILPDLASTSRKRALMMLDSEGRARMGVGWSAVCSLGWDQR